MDKYQVRIENITKTYASGRRQVQALSKVSLVLAAGQRLILLGKSGSGKTTFLSCLAGFERVDSGRIECFGTKIQALSPKKLSVFHRRDMGFLFQSGNLLSIIRCAEITLRLRDGRVVDSEMLSSFEKGEGNAEA